MTKARTISQYIVYNSNVTSSAVTMVKINDSPLLDDWGLITDNTFSIQEDFGTIT